MIYLYMANPAPENNLGKDYVAFMEMPFFINGEIFGHFIKIQNYEKIDARINIQTRLRYRIFQWKNPRQTGG